MAPPDYSVNVGTLGDGVWRSTVGGANFSPISGITPLDDKTRSIEVDPFGSSHVLARVGYPHFGLDENIIAEASWSRMERYAEIDVWRAALDPQVHGRYFAGTHRAGARTTIRREFSGIRGVACTAAV